MSSGSVVGNGVLRGKIKLVFYCGRTRRINLRKTVNRSLPPWKCVVGEAKVESPWMDFYFLIEVASKLPE